VRRFAVAVLLAACTPTPPPPASSTVVVPAPAPPAAPDDWQVSIFAKFEDGVPLAVEHWANLEHEWSEPCGPGKVVAERRLCLPKGRYVIEAESSEHAEVTLDGHSVIAPRIELARTIEGQPIELSRPIAIDDCVALRVEMPGRGCFPKSRIRVTIREARKTPPCDERSYPTGNWNVCIFAGRRQEELLETATWKEFQSPWPANRGPEAWEDNFSVEARTTACFDGKFVFHSRGPAERLQLFIDDTLADDSNPKKLEGCHQLRATYSARDHNTTFEQRWAKVGSAVEKQWALEALACDPPCAAGAECVAAAPFGVERKGARICLPRGRPGDLGEACSPSQRCRPRQELQCCRPPSCGGNAPGVCTYIDR